MSNFTSNGGGATRVAKVTGQLSSLSSNLSDILIISGGGGGGFITPGSSDLQSYIDKLKTTTCGASNQYSLLYWNLNRDGSRSANLPNIYSFIIPTGNFNNNATTYDSIYFCTVGTVDITNNGGGSITAEYDFVNAPNDCVSISYQTMYGQIKTEKGNYGVVVRQWSSNTLTVDRLLNISTIPSFTTSFNTMEACLQYLTQHFRHINVTVNGIPWEAYLNHVYSGAEAGGISGSGTKSANQSTGYAFGQGESNSGVSGGGGGLYGGYKGTSEKSGGAGSGYIGNEFLSNKKMVGFNVPTSSTASTKTESVQTCNIAPYADTPKVGNGFVRIHYKGLSGTTEDT